jgi:hypothetical protein
MMLIIIVSWLELKSGDTSLRRIRAGHNMASKALSCTSGGGQERRVKVGLGEWAELWLPRDIGTAAGRGHVNGRGGRDAST